MMLRPFIPMLANFFIIAFAIDAGLSLADEAIRATTDSLALIPLRNAIAAVVFSSCLAILVALALTPRLPASLLAPPALLGLWLNLGAEPLSLAVDSVVLLGLAVAVIQVLAAGWVLLAIRYRTDGRHWLLPPEAFQGPIFSVRHILASAAVAVFLLLPAAGLYTVISLGTAAQKMTRGFVVFDLEGISLADRRFRQLDHEIRLVGMMHIGEEQAYGRLFRSFATESTVVLTEGVTDDSNLMETRLSYAGAATSLGLTAQRNIEDYLTTARDDASISLEWPHVRHADVDISTFSPKSIAFIERASRLWGSDDIVAALLEMSRDPEFSDPQLLETLQKELIDDRNAVLLDHVDGVIDDYQHVVVPWGALHLPGIETEVIERGYTLERSELHRLITWSGLLAAIF